MDHAENDVNADRRRSECPKEIRVLRDSIQTDRAAQRGNIAKDHADNFTETERDDGKAIAFNEQRRSTDKQRGERSPDATCNDCEQKQCRFASDVAQLGKRWENFGPCK